MTIGNLIAWNQKEMTAVTVGKGYQQMTRNEIEAIVAQMTLEEKASLCSGGDFWHTKAVERLGVPAMMVSDGKRSGKSNLF